MTPDKDQRSMLSCFDANHCKISWFVVLRFWCSEEVTQEVERSLSTNTSTIAFLVLYIRDGGSPPVSAKCQIFHSRMNISISWRHSMQNKAISLIDICDLYRALLSRHCSSSFCCLSFVNLAGLPCLAELLLFGTDISPHVSWVDISGVR